eukprot:scaffold292375_cov33-Tisochrysis_lutea.AAC.3
MHWNAGSGTSAENGMARNVHYMSVQPQLAWSTASAVVARCALSMRITTQVVSSYGIISPTAFGQCALVTARSTTSEAALCALEQAAAERRI